MNKPVLEPKTLRFSTVQYEMNMIIHQDEGKNRDITAENTQCNNIHPSNKCLLVFK